VGKRADCVEVTRMDESTSYRITEGTPFLESERGDRRVERAAFETDLHRILGDVTLPPAGYQSRFSDALNRSDLSFIPLTNVEIISLADGQVIKQAFIALAKDHIRIAYPLGD
jgi:hypothetical protein